MDDMCGEQAKGGRETGDQAWCVCPFATQKAVETHWEIVFNAAAPLDEDITLLCAWNTKNTHKTSALRATPGRHNMCHGTAGTNLFERSHDKKCSDKYVKRKKNNGLCAHPLVVCILRGGGDGVVKFHFAPPGIPL